MAAVGDEMHDLRDHSGIRRGVVEAICRGLPVVRWRDGSCTIVTHYVGEQFSPGVRGFFGDPDTLVHENRQMVLVKWGIA